MITLSVAIFITIVDQFTKILIHEFYNVGDSTPVISGFFSITYVRNTGAAWGMLKDFNLMLIMLSIVVLICLAAFSKSFIRGSRLNALALGLMTGGILGNLLDRIRLGFVVDFLDFYRSVYHFPSFNVADSAICIGVSLFFVLSVIHSRHSTSQAFIADTSPHASN